MPEQLTISFAGTPELAATILQKLIEAEKYKIVSVYTQPDRPAGRGRKLHKSAVKELAELHQLPVKQPSGAPDLDPENELSSVDVLVVAAYGMLIPEAILNRPRLGCINVHTSLLPRWRGAAPIQRAIQAGDIETGVTIIKMDAGLDTGQILLQKSCPINSHETSVTLHDKLALLGAEALLELLSSNTNCLEGYAQDNSRSSYANKITKEEAEIDWCLPARTIERTIRAFNPKPVAYTVLNNKPMKIWEASVIETDLIKVSPGTVLSSSSDGIDVTTGEQLLRIKRLQLPGKKIITSEAFHNGHPDFACVNQHS
jgi:methionyl-tRNA formyltransferase